MSVSLEAYTHHYSSNLCPIATKLEELLRSHLADAPHIDRISARAKTPGRFLVKAAKLDPSGNKRYEHPWLQIQDTIGARIVVFYKSDIEVVAKIVSRYLLSIEFHEVAPDGDWEFGYFGRHFVLALPKDAVPEGIDLEAAPKFFELQIKTLFQHAWSEANHDLGYKPKEELEPNDRRLLAFTSAQAWGADNIFAELVAKLGIP